MAASTQTLIVKLHFGTDIRRFTVKDTSIINNADLTWASLAERVARSFDLNEKKKIKITYVDDEKDVITISTDEELKEAVALALASEPSVLRLTIAHKKQDKSDKSLEAKPLAEGKEKAEAQPTPPAAPHVPALPAGVPAELAPFLDTLVKQLPAAMASLPEGLKQMLPHAELDLAATVAANTPAGRAADPFCPAEPHAAGAAEGVHEGVSCDKSGVCPIVGNRYHLVGHNYDLCEAEFLKLSDKEKAHFRVVPPPGAPPPAAPTAPAAPTPSADDAPANNVHPGVTCDRSGQSPITGIRFHLRGHNYDLCQAEFDKLPEAEKALYTAIPPPPLGGGNGPWRPGPWGWRGGGGCGGKKWGGMHGMAGMAGMHGMGGGHHHGAEPKLAARFVRDVTIFDGTQMAPGTAFTKIWRLKNVGEVPWPAGAKMLFVGGDQMTTEMAVPLSRASPVLPGEEVDVAVEMTAPTEHGRYLGYWRLTGPHMRRKFGQRVWCHVQVVDPSQSGAEAFDDMASTLAEIERKKSTVAADDEPADDELDAATAKDLELAAVPCDAVPCEAAPCEAPTTAADTPPVDVTDGAPSAAATATAGGAPVAATIVAVAATSTSTTSTTSTPTAVDGAGAKDDDAKDDSKDGSVSDDGVVLVTDGMVAEANAEANAAAADAPSKAASKAPLETAAAAGPAAAAAGPSGGVRAELTAMGFTDETLLDAVLESNGQDVEACARDLAAATEWAHLLDDLDEMGFANRALNASLMLKNGGNMKRTVRDLVEA